jgi:hypothetical protein
MTLTDLFVYGTVCVVMLLIAGIAIGTVRNVKGDYKEMKKENSKEIPSLDLTHEEFYKTLNFLLMYGVITFEEYGEIERKSLTFVK